MYLINYRLSSREEKPVESSKAHLKSVGGVAPDMTRSDGGEEYQQAVERELKSAMDKDGGLSPTAFQKLFGNK